MENSKGQPNIEISKKKKLQKDLEVVRDNLTLYNELLDNKEVQLADELIGRI